MPVSDFRDWLKDKINHLPKEHLTMVTFMPNAKVIKWYEIVDKWCTELQVSQSLILAMIQQESGGNENAVRYEPAYEQRYILNNKTWLDRCRAGGFTSKEAATSYGLMQIMFPTAWNYNVTKPKELFDPSTNIRVGTAIMAGRLKKYTIEDALVTYNGGEGALLKPSSSAWRYSKNVYTLFQKYKEWNTNYRVLGSSKA